MDAKKELIEKAQQLADEYNSKKEVIETALNNLDSKVNTGVSIEHINGMSIIESMFNELDKIELQQLEIFEKIKKI